MIDQLKARLRAWLIDLVREAIRSERVQPGNTYTLRTGPTMIPDSSIQPVSGPATFMEQSRKEVHNAHPIFLEPSFEQMQAEAIQAQEKYYVEQK